MTPHPDDTIVALSSAVGPGRRAVVRVTGPAALPVVRAVFPQAESESDDGRQIVLGAGLLSDVHSRITADLYVWRAPRTYTGQDLVELHVVSSPPLVERLVADLLAAGARSAQPGEFTLRAFLAGKKDLTQAEAVLGVIEAGTDADLTQALAQLAGGVTQPLGRLRADLLDLLADVEAGLDFADEDIEFVSKADLLARVGAALAHLTNLRRQLDDRGVSGRVVRVVLTGEPNAGKSSLFNALAGDAAAIVSPHPGTTRDYLVAPLTLGSVPVELIDTAGWQSADDTIAEQAQQVGRAQLGRADVALWCVPRDQGVDPARWAWLRQTTGAEVVCVRTKCDDDLRAGTRGAALADAIRTSAVVPGGVTELRVALADRVAALARPPLAPSLSRCRHHVEVGLAALRRAHEHVREDDPPELIALALREALGEIGAMAGVIYTNDLLDRIFSRFCIGK